MRKFEFISDEQMKEDLEIGLAVIPKRGTRFSSGYDFIIPMSVVIHPGETVLIPTGIKACMEKDEVLQLYPRSSLGFKYRLQLCNTVGIIDSDYYSNPKNDGHIWVKYHNAGDEVVRLKEGDAFCQGIFTKFLLVDGDNFIDGEDRVGGIGSTNKEN